MTQRRATYRLQLHEGFDFAAAAAQADYLAALGVSHVYCSPYLQAARGSTHGYDVVDPTRISVDLGGDAGHRSFTETLRSHGLSQLLDIVPNHMSVADPGNRWWWDVLADGMSSPFARFFDIDWEIDEPKMRHRVLLPVLADQVGRVVEEGGIAVVRARGELLIAAGDGRFPLSIESTAELLATSGCAAVIPVVEAVARLHPGDGAASRRERYQRRQAILADLAERLADAATAAAVDATVAARNADFAALDQLLNEQHHRLARWRVADEEVNYRRFFDINTLVALRIEDPEVFAEATSLVADLVRRGDVDGLRIDHIDGLRRPLEYARRLREATPPATWLIAEKILARGEQPPPWPLDGTTGYDFLAVVNGLFVDPDGREPLEALHHEITGNDADFERAARDGKREILRTTMVGDVDRLSHLLATVADDYPTHRDHTRSELTEAIVELIAALPVYRTYVVPADGTASDLDAGIIRGAAALAHADNPDVDPRLLDFIADLFVVGEGEDLATGDTAANRQARNDLVLRIQQLGAAATAKGVEDTACYRHTVLVSLNEVGDSPAHFGTSVAEFHDHNRRVQQRGGLTLLTTSTHDTKRSEDVRCRIDLLSEIPEQWAATVRHWRDINAAHRDEVVDGAIEYLLYQTLVGAHPIGVERAAAYMRKAAREARLHTGWLKPDDAYEAALESFVAAILEDPRYSADLNGFVAGLIPHGRVNSLSTALLKLTSPGVPDVYQGTELWDLSLVDPDNRRPVDYALRARLLDQARAAPLDVAWTADPDSGAAKVGLIATALAVRARRPEAFGLRAPYTPIPTAGEFADDVIAFTRGDPASVLSLAQRRSLRRRGNWGDTMITLPDGWWTDACTGAGWRDGVRIAELLGAFPVALLERAA